MAMGKVDRGKSVNTPIHGIAKFVKGRMLDIATWGGYMTGISDGDAVKMLVMDYAGAIANPELARKLMTPGKSFKDDRAREIALEIVLADGQWERAVDALEGHSPAWLTKLRARLRNIGGAK